MNIFQRTRRNFIWYSGLTLGLMVGGLASGNEAIQVPLQTQRTWDFASSGVHFDCQFSGARLNGCEPLDDHDFKVVISPENQPINPSPWYAFKVSSDQSRPLALHFVYTYSTPRGRPWLSTNGTDWARVTKADYTLGPGTNEATLNLTTGPNPLWVSAWDMLSLPQMNAWMDSLLRHPFIHEEVAGTSIEKRPLRAFVIGETTQRNYVFVIGRQHPPEITGSIGLQVFVDTVAGDSALARRYRQQFQTVVVPVVNPDGVEHGHWRSNLGGVDLNRDWADFSQPETRAMRDYIQKYDRLPGAKPWLFLDFHSTGTNVFYAQPELKGDALPKFADHWLAALHQELPAFGFDRDDLHNAGVFTSKAWANGELHAPAITCEFGYATDRKIIRQASRLEAEQMMRLVLAGAASATGE